MKKTISIREVSSDDVIQHIVPADGTQNFPKRRQNGNHAAGKRELTYCDSPSQRSKYRGTQRVTDSDDDFDNNNEITGVSKALDVDDPDFADGQEIFQFRTPKKSGQMALKAEISSPLTPNKKLDRKSKEFNKKDSPFATSKCVSTPPRTKRQTSTDLLTPKKSHGVAAVREHKRLETSTPYRLRKRNLVLEGTASSSDDSVDSASSDEEESKSDQDEKENSYNSERHCVLETTDTAVSAETYFDLHSMNPVTSDHTLSTLDMPRMDVNTVRETLQGVDLGHQEELKALWKKHHKLFNKWMLNMCTGFNILLHGLGSKRSLLDSFRKEYLCDFSHLVVNGYFPSLTVKHILNSITEDLLDCSQGFTNVSSHLDFIGTYCKERDEDFYLLIHNIDGVLLRSEKAQTVLSHLAEVKGFHIIASVDHINAVFLWDQNRYFRYRWLWYETPTFVPYEAENSYENSLMVQQSGALALSSLVHVMRSLTPNAKRVFLLLVEHQLEYCDNATYDGMPFQALYHKCRESFLVNSDLTLQAQLVEFKDHRLIRLKKNYEGVEHLIIPIDKVTLKEFMQDYSENS